MRIVVALGGNALLRRGEPMEASIQRERVEAAARAVASIARQHQVVLTHGNGPQVGLLALQAEAYHAVHPYPLDVLGAESEGMIGYVIQQALANELPGRDIATVLTEVLVDAEDSAFAHPTKPVGPVYSKDAAAQISVERGWDTAPDGHGYRRVVASPQPREIVQIDTIRALVEAGVMVICSGGGGIPTVLDNRSGKRVGVEAVIDKDLSAALLAIEIRADFLLLLTDVDAVYAEWGTPQARPIGATTPQELRKFHFAGGSMAPKVEAACRFVEATGQRAAIGSLERAIETLAGSWGTCILPRSDRPERAPAASIQLKREPVATARMAPVILGPISLSRSGEFSDTPIEGEPVADLIPPEGASEAQSDAFVASLRKDAREHVRELLSAGASEVEVAEFMASLEPLSTDAISAGEGQR